jgi:cobalamin biosynthesis protein CobW
MSPTVAGHAHGDGHAHSGLGTHEHGLLTHEHVHAEDPGWLSFVLRSQTAQTPDTLYKALDLITAQEPVLRVKGFAHVHDAAGHLLVQGVRTRIACTMETTDQPQHDGHHHHVHTPGPVAELVFIGYHLNRDVVVAKLSEQTGTAWY